MITLPEPAEPSPEQRTSGSYLRWLAKRQWTSILAGCLFDTVWLVGLSLVPWAVGHAIDEGIVQGDNNKLAFWGALTLALSLVHAAVQGLRDRSGIVNWSRAAFRSVQVLAGHSVHAGHAITSRLSSGEFAATVSSDAFGIAYLYFMIGALVSSGISYALVGSLLLQVSVPLGAMVLIGVPAFAAVFFTIARPLQARQSAQRDLYGRMTEIGSDTVLGLRVLRGIGGERIFVNRYRRLSDQTRTAGESVATPLAAIEGLQILLGGILVVALVWVGGWLVSVKQLEVGELVSFYGYAGFLLTPIKLVAGSISTYTRSRVGADRLLQVLQIAPITGDAAVTHHAPKHASAINDDTSGLLLLPDKIAALVANDLEDASAIISRITRVDDSAIGAANVMWGGLSIVGMPLAEVRRNIVIGDAEPYFFSGTLRELIDPHGMNSDDDINAVLDTASARDVVNGLRGGLSAKLGEGARELSGGQRQRIGLARALLTRARILVLDQPTSAVDANTEARIARSLRAARPAGSSTLIVTTSPVLLSIADDVSFVRDGRVQEYGTHHALLEASAEYRAAVLRDGIR